VSHSVICISSQDGAGAHETAQAVSTTLGLRILDEDIITTAAREAGVDEHTMADVERRKSRLQSIIEGIGVAGGGVYTAPGAEYIGTTEPASEGLRSLISTVIEETAAQGSVLIVSHAASIALGAREDVLRVLLTAPVATRTARLAAMLGADEREAAKVLKRSDDARGDYIKRFYGVGDELPTHYDLVINTEKLSPDQAAGLIVSAAAA